MKRLIFACPTYGPVDPEAVASQRAAIMHASNYGIVWVGDAAPDRMKFDAGRNTIVKAVLEIADRESAEGVFWCDSDVLFHEVNDRGGPAGAADAITRLAHDDKDFVTGVLCQRQAPYFPLIARFDPSSASFNWVTGMPRDKIAPMDGCGFGCVLTSVALLRAIPPPWFAFEKYSEDFDFCLKAKTRGFQLYADTGVRCTHLGDRQRIRVQDFETFRDAGGLTHAVTMRSDDAA